MYIIHTGDKNLPLATIFLQLVTKRRLEDFFRALQECTQNLQRPILRGYFQKFCIGVCPGRVLQISSDGDDQRGQRSKPQKIPRTPNKSLDRKLTPKKSHAKFPSFKNFQKAKKWYNMKNKNIRNWLFVFVFSSYHLKLSYAGTSTNF